MTKILRTVKYVRGPIGTLLKWLFIGFNLLMFFMLFKYWGDVAPLVGTGSSASQAGAAIGSTIGTGIILMIWVLGTIILGIPVLLTKGKRIEIEETSSPAAARPPASDTVSISVAAAQKHLQMQTDNDDLQPKLKSQSKLALQYMGFVLFFLLGFMLLFSDVMQGLGMIVAGALLLPTIQASLVKTPLKSPRAIFIAMICTILVTSYIGTMGSSSTQVVEAQKSVEDAQLAEKNIRQQAEKDFAENSVQVMQELSIYADNKNWANLKNKTELLLGTGDAKIKEFYEAAVNGLIQEEDEKKKLAQELLITEFKEKRAELIAQLKKELANKNYGYAETIGAAYMAVADKEFKNLHDTAAEKQKVVLEKQAAEAAAAPWSYFQSDDPMSKGKTYQAVLLSSNTVSFDFPYSGPQNGKLMLRTDPKYGKDVIFSIEKGQILCPSYDECSVLVRFDEGKATTYSASGAADNSTETIFIRNYSRFSEQMMKAKRVRLSVNIYQEGAPVFDFDVSGFNSDKYKPKTQAQ